MRDHRCLGGAFGRLYQTERVPRRQTEAGAADGERTENRLCGLIAVKPRHQRALWNTFRRLPDRSHFFDCVRERPRQGRGFEAVPPAE